MGNYITRPFKQRRSKHQKIKYFQINFLPFFQKLKLNQVYNLVLGLEKRPLKLLSHGRLFPRFLLSKRKLSAFFNFLP